MIWYDVCPKCFSCELGHGLWTLYDLRPHLQPRHRHHDCRLNEGRNRQDSLHPLALQAPPIHPPHTVTRVQFPRKMKLSSAAEDLKVVGKCHQWIQLVHGHLLKSSVHLPLGPADRDTTNLRHSVLAFLAGICASSGMSSFDGMSM